MRVKKDENIEQSIGNFFIGIGIFIIYVLKTVARLIKLLGIVVIFLFASYGMGIKFLASKCKKYNSKFARFKRFKRNLLLTIAITVTIINIVGIYNLAMTKVIPHNNMILIINPCYFFLLGMFLKLAKIKEAKKIIKLNKGLENKFLAYNFQDSLKKIPLLVNIFLLNKYFKEYLFFSNISLAVWQKNKDVIEEILNKRILKIETIPNNYDMKKVIVSNSKEPTFTPFSLEYINDDCLKVWIGHSIYGEPLYYDFDDSPHLIISGGTGKGKSVSNINFFVQLKREQNRIILCDFKRNTYKLFKKYNNNKPIITEREPFYKMLKWLKSENDRRTKLFEEDDEIEKISEWNKKYEKSKLQNIIVMIDELSVITSEGQKDNIQNDIKDIITTIAKLGRSQGIHLIVSTQKPSCEVVPTGARTNFDGAITGGLRDEGASKMAIGDNSATKITNIIGRMLVKKGSEIIEYQAVFVDKKDIGNIIKSIGGLKK